ncbi:hypothetical protein [Yoonia sediminilitoris]|uniref:hypothetical protein n=1 Tax=Yoonia sediminilitoris TaxID=1286148 RepID=UPI000D352F17|nr:hypothetical protein [Yoonia sediminilitoris]
MCFDRYSAEFDRPLFCPSHHWDAGYRTKVSRNETLLAAAAMAAAFATLTLAELAQRQAEDARIA